MWAQIFQSSDGDTMDIIYQNIHFTNSHNFANSRVYIWAFLMKRT